MSRDALVVGISTYQYLPGLNAPAQDAEAIAHQLETYGDFRVARLPEIVQAEKLHVGLKTPVTLAELETALVKLFKPKGSNIPQTALFYFSGHGLQKEAGIREGYLATSDTNPNGNFYGLSLFWLRRLLQESPVRQRIVLLDCCHSGEILNYLEADPGAKSGTDRLFMAASREYESAYESLAGQYSVFTQALLDGIDPRRLATGIITNYALTDWVSNALKGEVQQPLFENSGSEIILTRCQNPLTTINATPVSDICPYRGLQPFDQGHAEYFFGREHLTDQLLEKVRQGNFLAVVGASGSGKSSLVQAGLTYKLQRGQTLSGSNTWQVRLITPTDQPLKSLADAFVNPDTTPMDRADQLRRAELFLQEGGSGLSQLVRANLMSAPGNNARMVLIIDQFEEVFTLCQGPHAERDRHRFFNCLLAAQRELGNQLSLVIVLRADFFSKCSFYTGLAEQIEQNLVMVTPLTYEQIKASILKPAEKVGLVCEPNLVYNILLDIVGAPGELPLLQYTLLELWHRRQQDPNGGAPHLTLTAYNDLGGVRGTLQKRANEIFYSLTLGEQQVAKRIFIALTQLGEGTEDTRRRVLKSELASSQVSSELVERVLEKLVVAKLVVTNQVAPTGAHQERVDQRFANMSTALRLAQVVRNKSPQFAQNPQFTQSLSNITSLQKSCTLNVTRISQLAAGEMLQVAVGGESCQETVDIAHEALIRNWSLLRSWLDENRDMLRQQRQIERSAREWHNALEPRSVDFLLHGSRLVDAEDYLNQYPDDLSALAQRFITISRTESLRTRREVRLLQITVPLTLMLALGATFYQYRLSVKNQNEKDYQLQVATSRQWSAIAQSVLQDPTSDPTTALLISRLAADRGQTSEAEASLRAALQKLRLQATLQGHGSSIQQFAFSPDQYHIATIEQRGGVRLWSLKTQTVEQVLAKDEPVETPAIAPAEPTKTESAKTEPSAGIDSAIFTADGKWLVVATHRSSEVRVWSVETGKLRWTLKGGQGYITQLAVSPNGSWIATASHDQTLRLWQMESGKLQTQLMQKATIQALQFSANGRSLMVASGTTAVLLPVDDGHPAQTLAHPKSLTSATLSPDDRWLATATEDGGVRVWDRETGKLRQMITPFNPNKTSGSTSPMVMTVRFSPDGRALAIAAASGQVQLWNWETGQHWQITETDKPGDQDAQQAKIAFSPDSRMIVVARRSQQEDQIAYLASIRDVQTGKEVGILQGHTAPFTAVQFNIEGSLIATANQDGTMRLWSAEASGEFPSLKIEDKPIQWVAFQHNAPKTTVDLAAATTASLQPSPRKLADGSSSSPVGILAVATSGIFHQWDLGEQRALAPLPPETTCTGDTDTEFAAPTPAKRMLDTLHRWADRLNRIRYQIQDQFAHLSTVTPNAQQSLSAPLIQPTPSAQPIDSTHLSQSVLSGSATSANLTDYVSAGATLTSIAFSADGQRVAIGDSSGKVELWKIRPDRSMQSLQHLQEPAPQADSQGDRAPDQPRRLTNVVRQLSFSPDGQTLVGVGVDLTLRLWEVPSGKLLHRLVGHEAFVEQAQFSADGQRVVSASWDRTARIWEVATGKLLATLKQPNELTSAHFSPDGQRLVVTSLDSTARIINRDTGLPQVILAGHHKAIFDAEFSPDGRTVVTASADGTARLWNASTGIEKALLHPSQAVGGEDSVKRAFFSPDGQYIATLNSQGRLDLWTAGWQNLLDLARDRSLRQLKPEECLRYLRLTPNQCPELSMKADEKHGK